MASAPRRPPTADAGPAAALAGRHPRVRAAQPRAHPPDPREADRRHAAAAHVRAAVRLRLRRRHRRPRRQLPRVPDRRHPRADARLRDDGPGDVDRHRPERGHRRPLPLAADVALRVPARPHDRRARGRARWRSRSCRSPGSIVGWRIHTDCSHALAGFGLLLLFAFAMLWIGTLLGISSARPTRSQGIVFMVVFPLTFLASTFVPVDGLPPGCARSPSGTRSARSPPRSGRCSATRPRRRPTRRGRSQHPVLASVIWCV